MSKRPRAGTQATLQQTYSKKSTNPGTVDMDEICQVPRAPPLIHDVLWSVAGRTPLEKYNVLLKQSAAAAGAAVASLATRHSTSSSKRTACDKEVCEERKLEEERKRRAEQALEAKREAEVYGHDFVSLLEQLLAPSAALPLPLQEELGKMVAKHPDHLTSLSVRALQLLLLNAQLHPPCSIAAEEPHTLLVNASLWVPGARDIHDNERRPHAHIQFDLLYKRYHQLWQAAAKTCAEPAATGTRIPGELLELHLINSLLQADLDVRMAALRGADQSNGRAVDVVWDSLLLRMMRGANTASWMGEKDSHPGLLKHLLICIKAVQAIEPSLASRPSGSSQEPKQQELPGQAPHRDELQLSGLASLGLAAGRMLCKLYDAWTVAEAKYDRLYKPSGSHTDRAQLAMYMLEVGFKNVANDYKLVVLAALSPQARLHLLTLDFTSKVERSLQEQQGLAVLPPDLEVLQAYARDKGRGLFHDLHGGQAEPTLILGYLQPNDPSVATSIKAAGSAGSTSPRNYLEEAQTSLWRVGKSAKDLSGFLAWLSVYTLAALQHHAVDHKLCENIRKLSAKVLWHIKQQQEKTAGLPSCCLATRLTLSVLRKAQAT